MIRRFKVWNKWRKNCLNGPLHKFLVLIGLVHSPTFQDFQMFEEWRLETPDMYLRNCKEDTPARVAYICDRTACAECNPECHHTFDINHARNFECIAENEYWEKEIDYQKFADEVLEMLNMYCDDGNEIYIKKRVLEVNMKSILEEFV